MKLKTVLKDNLAETTLLFAFEVGRYILSKPCGSDHARSLICAFPIFLKQEGDEMIFDYFDQIELSEAGNFIQHQQ